MKITRLEKEARYNTHSVKISLDIEIGREELENIEYEGFDLLPDHLIADVLIAIGRKYSKAIKQGEIDEEKVESII